MTVQNQRKQVQAHPSQKTFLSFLSLIQIKVLIEKDEFHIVFHIETKRVNCKLRKNIFVKNIRQQTVMHSKYH